MCVKTGISSILWETVSNKDYDVLPLVDLSHEKQIHVFTTKRVSGSDWKLDASKDFLLW